MRILVLTILFVGTFYYFNQEDKVSSTEESIDLVKVKMSAPGRVNSEEIPKTNSSPKLQEVKAEIAEEVSENKIIEDDPEHFQELSSNDLEADWNVELKEMLSRLEPAEAEEIHKSYLAQQESYQSQLDNYLNEKEQKTSEEEINEIEQAIAQLDQSHQNSLKEILGAHYEAVRDHYLDFVEASQSDD